MEISRIIELANDGVNMCADGNALYIRSGKLLRRYDIESMAEAAREQVFKKDGKSRAICIGDDTLFLRDFCDLYAVNRHTLVTLRTWRLGENLSSDICAMTCDGGIVYAAIRGGGITAVDAASGEARHYAIADASMWDIWASGPFLYAVTVNGELCVIDRRGMTLIRKKQIHRKNIYSLLLDEGMLYTVSQDAALLASDAATLEPISAAKKAVAGMAVIVGMYENTLITATPGRNEAALWDKRGLNLMCRLDFPTGGLGRNGVLLHGNTLYGSAPDGIYALNLCALKR